MNKNFAKTAVEYFEKEVGRGMIQRIDGVECFSPLSDFWFWRIRLAMLVRKGVSSSGAASAASG
jgi:hypothetical protein